MNLSEVQDLLNEASAFDGRPVTDDTVLAWHRLLRNLDSGQAMKAMRTHFETEDKRLMPVHIVQGVKKLRAELMGGYQGPGLSKEIPQADPDDVMGYMKAARTLRITAGDGKPVNVLALEGQIGRMPNYMMGRDSTPMVVPCEEVTCRALTGRQCRGKKGETREPHQVRVEAFTVWRESKERHSA